MNAAALRYELSAQEQRRRLLGAHLINLLPYPVYRQVVGFIKRNRKTDAFDCNPVIPQGQKGSVRLWLTQDIDTKSCWAGLPAILDIQEKYGMRSTTHFLTSGPYRLEAPVLDAMEARGFEIGLHGVTHDTAIGFRDDRTIRDHVQRGLNALQRPVISYRAPALGVSERLLSILEETGFLLDTSIPMQLFYRKGVQAYEPYIYPGTGITEVPLTIQDVNFLSDLHLSDDDALALFAQLLNGLKAVSGTFVFNTHPVHMAKRAALYDSMMKLAANDPDVSVIKTNRDLIKS